MKNPKNSKSDNVEKTDGNGSNYYEKMHIAIKKYGISGVVYKLRFLFYRYF